MSGKPRQPDTQAPSAEPRRTVRTTPRRPGSLSGRGQQRAKILSAVRKLTHERGYAAVSASAVIASSRVSSKTFYEHFEDAELCFAAAYDEAIAEVRGVVMPVYQQRGTWLQRVRAALQTLLCELDRDPSCARMLFVEAQRGGPDVQRRRARVKELMTVIVDGGRSEATGALPALTDEVLVGDALSVIRARLSEPAGPPLTTLGPELMAVLAHTYLGADAANEELVNIPAIASSAAAVLAPAASAVPLRLTHRTLAVLRAMAEQPGSSNRDLAAAAGITDQGQISRLLTRLQSHELIVNERDGELGTPNAWYLTPRGEQVRQTPRSDLTPRQSP
jgi:AcrR family transcriptional regulator